MVMLLGLLKSPMLWVAIGLMVVAGYVTYEWQERAIKIAALMVENSKLVNRNRVLKVNIELERGTIDALAERLKAREGSVDMLCKAWDKANEDTEDPVGGVLDALPTG